MALDGALKRAGLHYHSHEYNAALKRVLESPNAEADWLAGKDILAGILPDPGGDMFDNLGHRELYEAAFG